MNPRDVLEDLIEQRRINILPGGAYSEYTKMALEKFVDNFDISFQGNINVNLLFTQVGPFILDIFPSDKQSYIHFVTTKKNPKEDGIICGYSDCMQISLRTIGYQIRYSNNN
jgi:hypothetical protein